MFNFGIVGLVDSSIGLMAILSMPETWKHHTCDVCSYFDKRVVPAKYVLMTWNRDLIMACDKEVYKVHKH